VGPGARYKFQVLGADGHTVLKADPLARQAEAPPATASIVPDERPFAWTDKAWMEQRAARQRCDAPISIYEVHAGSWFDDAGAPRWQNLAARLPEYARSLGFTHIELLPVMAHPFGGSWGYQPLGLFAPAAAHGAPADFAHFVDRCHEAGLGVILDWVPAHFPDDAHGLARLDGTPLYEHADPREGRHPDWNTLIYNYGRREVRTFLIASAIHWLRHYHVDGLRVDAVASMLYRDYSRPAGQWIPNRHGRRENLEAIDFLRELNAAVGVQCPGAITVAEESTAWPGVTAPVANGGLGFDYKWNMGWMHDTLRYMRRDPIHRRHHHHDLSFGMVYAYAERFVLPLSHDEVVHGKGSLLGKMPGERAAQLAQLRLYYAFMWAHPGKKLLFMGGEFGQQGEWNHDAMLQWSLLDDPAHRGLQRLVADLNHVYATLPELHCRDADPSGFAWIVGDDADNSVLAFARVDASHCLVAVCNFTPVPRPGYRFGVPHAGDWRVRVDTGA
ncbi:1,4-alpha-glucan branching protein GlgB, partial [Bordetella pertussis]